MDKKVYAMLERDVLNKGLCHGCGTCAGVCHLGSIDISFGNTPANDADPEPVLRGECDDCEICYATCPGKDVPLPDIDKALFGRERNLRTESLGVLKECLGGFARNERWRAIGAGGGATLAVLDFAFQNKLIDAVIISMPSEAKPWRIEPGIAFSMEEVGKLSEYGYCLVPVNALLKKAVEQAGGEKRLAIVGLPCHIHGLRKIQLLGVPEWIVNKIVFSIGIFCPTNFFWEYTKHLLVELGGIENLGDIANITFQGGSTPKHLYVRLINGREVEIDTFTHLLWGVANFVHQRCAVCWDWTAEVADLSIGDFWEPWLAPGDPGWSTIITRTEVGEEVIYGAQKQGYLYARPTPEEFLIASFCWELKKHAAATRLNWRTKHTTNPVPDYGYAIEQVLGLRPPKCSPWRANARLYGLLTGTPREEGR